MCLLLAGRKRESISMWGREKYKTALRLVSTSDCGNLSLFTDV
jgi:hypothetical protein